MLCVQEFGASMAGGAAGTLASAPLNFVRNIQFATPAHETAPSTYQILADLMRECRSKQAPFSYVQERLRIGWGTARVAVGKSLRTICHTQSSTINSTFVVILRICMAFRTRLDCEGHCEI